MYSFSIFSFFKFGNLILFWYIYIIYLQYLIYMQNHLFNQALLKKYSTEYKLNPRKHDLLKEYIRKVDTGDFKSETKNYLYFYDVILKDILGYDQGRMFFLMKREKRVQVGANLF